MRSITRDIYKLQNGDIADVREFLDTYLEIVSQSPVLSPILFQSFEVCFRALEVTLPLSLQEGRWEVGTCGGGG